jgi:hypothetical protein
VLARANNRAISLAVFGKRVGATTVECCGQRIMITCGMSGGLSSSPGRDLVAQPEQTLRTLDGEPKSHAGALVPVLARLCRGGRGDQCQGRRSWGRH